MFRPDGLYIVLVFDSFSEGPTSGSLMLVVTTVVKILFPFTSLPQLAYTSTHLNFSTNTGTSNVHGYNNRIQLVL